MGSDSFTADKAAMHAAAGRFDDATSHLQSARAGITNSAVGIGQPPAVVGAASAAYADVYKQYTSTVIATTQKLIGEAATYSADISKNLDGAGYQYEQQDSGSSNSLKNSGSGS